MTTTKTSRWWAGSTLAAALTATLLLAGCGSTPLPRDNRPVVSQPVYRNPSAVEYGTVSSVQPIEHKQGIGVGAVVGGVVGGLLGNQVGAGDGRKAATAAGVVGGAVVGHQVQKRTGDSNDGVQYSVTMESGEQRTFTAATDLNLRVGQRVRLVDGALQPY